MEDDHVVVATVDEDPGSPALVVTRTMGVAWCGTTEWTTRSHGRQDFGDLLLHNEAQRCRKLEGDGCRWRVEATLRRWLG